MILSLASYRDKVRGCWLGKNIGGTLGAPFEGKRQLNDLTFYAQDLRGNPPPNDDLDLQLVWLGAVEKYGRQLNSRILGEYWLSYIIPNWVEYGAGKTNLRMGLVPPLSGHFNNPYKDSCGCFIRSEIWACLAPGHPEIAVEYAFEDAIVDHAHEGLYGEVFCAALESAAFVEQAPFKLIEIGLSYIPENCGVARGVKKAVACFESGLSWQEARGEVLEAVPGTFGVQGTPSHQLPTDIPIGERGWDAPSNIGIIIIGWLYGEGDFGKSLCLAVNCGEDTDCTAATLGAILGITGGIQSIPKEWREPIGDEINTICINTLDGGLSIPKTVTELTERTLRLTPLFLGSSLCDVLAEGGYTIDVRSGDDLYHREQERNFWIKESFAQKLAQSPNCVHYDFIIFNTLLDYLGDPVIRPGTPRKFKLVLGNNICQQQWLKFKWHLPDGWTVSPSAQGAAYLDLSHMGKTVLEYELTAETLDQSHYDLFLEISSQGHPTRGIIPIVLLNS